MTNTIYAPHDEPILMNRLFPNPQKVKTIKRENIVGGREKQLPDWDNLDFMFRGEFENCGPKISGNILKYNKKRRRGMAKKLKYYWGYW